MDYKFYEPTERDHSQYVNDSSMLQRNEAQRTIYDRDQFEESKIIRNQQKIHQKQEMKETYEFIKADQKKLKQDRNYQSK